MQKNPGICWVAAVREDPAVRGATEHLGQLGFMIARSYINPERILTNFLSILSVNSPTRAEGTLARMLAGDLALLGGKVEVAPPPPGWDGDSGNVLAWFPPTDRSLPPVFLNAHLDTVKSTEGLVIVQTDGWVRSDGRTILGADDKAGLASIVEALTVICERNVAHGGIQVIFTVGEEVGLRGAQSLDRGDIRGEFGFVLDSGVPVGTVVDSAPYHAKLHVTVTGRAAHAGVCPEDGVSAINVAAQAIARLEWGRIDIETTSNIGTIAGGEATNIVAAECRLSLEARSLSLESLRNEMCRQRAAFERAAAAADAWVSFQEEMLYSGYRHPADLLPLKLALDSAQRLGLPHLTAGTGGGSDCNVFNALGLPTVLLTCGIQKNHTPEECVRIEDLCSAAAWLVDILVNLPRKT